MHDCSDIRDVEKVAWRYMQGFVVIVTDVLDAVSDWCSVVVPTDMSFLRFSPSMFLRQLFNQMSLQQ